MSDRIVVMRDGEIEQQGTPQEIYSHPVSRFTAGFVGETNLLEGTAERGKFQVAALALTLSVSSSLSGSIALSVRPEAANLFGRGEAVLAGTIDDSIFVGSIVRHQVRLDDGSIFVVQELPSEGGVRTRGDAVEVTWTMSDTVVLER